VVAPPPGPSFAAMPGNGKTYEQFQADNGRCQQAAMQAAGPVSPAQAANQSAVGSAVVGTALGAGAGALIGAAAGAPGVGAAVGANNAQASAATLQQRYDTTYAQCMTAAGNSIPPPPPPYGYAYPAYAPPASY